MSEVLGGQPDQTKYALPFQSMRVPSIAQRSAAVAILPLSV